MDQQERGRILGLHRQYVQYIAPEWDFEIVFDTIPGFDPENDGRPVMACSPNWPYLKAKVVVDIKLSRHLGWDELVEYYLHELGHVFVSPVTSCSEEARAENEEQLATRFARMVYALQLGNPLRVLPGRDPKVGVKA